MPLALACRLCHSMVMEPNTEATPAVLPAQAGVKYSDSEWSEATGAIEQALQELEDARAAKRMAQGRCVEALEVLKAARARRDDMLATDRRSASYLGSLAGVSPSRIGQVRGDTEVKKPKKKHAVSPPSRSRLPAPLTDPFQTAA